MPQITQTYGANTNSHRWAWENPHLTSKISKCDRVTVLQKKKSGRGRLITKIRKPLASLKQKLSTLRLLIRVSYFRRWPLRVCFFSNHSWDEWGALPEFTAIDPNYREMGGGIDVRLSLREVAPEVKANQRLDPQESIEDNIDSAPKKKRTSKWDHEGVGGLQGLDITYGMSPLIRERYVLSSHVVCRSHPQKSQENPYHSVTTGGSLRMQHMRRGPASPLSRYCRVPSRSV